MHNTPRYKQATGEGSERTRADPRILLGGGGVSGSSKGRSIRIFKTEFPLGIGVSWFKAVCFVTVPIPLAIWFSHHYRNLIRKMVL